MSECYHLKPTPCQACVHYLSVNQSVSQLIELTNLSVSKKVSVTSLSLPPTHCVLMSVNQSESQLKVLTNISVNK